MNSSHTSALRRLAVTSLVTIACAGAAVTAQAAFIATASEIGGAVVFTGSGSIDLTATNSPSTQNGSVVVNPSAQLGVGPTGFSSRDTYTFSSTVTGPSTIGSGTTQVQNTAGTGDYLLFNWETPFVAVPAGYNSGDPLSGSSTFAGQTFATLGITPGSYEWTWGSGASADSYTLNVGAVPVPAAVWLFGSGLLGLVGMARRKKA